jgi:ssDNA-binding Zn-finger/Zn-ribbon topoisomerase 1
VRIKLDERCPLCGTYLELIEEKDGIYILCRNCRVATYAPAEAAAGYAADFPTLIKIMSRELVNVARRAKQKRRS